VRVRRERGRTLLTERGFFVCLLSKVDPDFYAGPSTSFWCSGATHGACFGNSSTGVFHAEEER